MRLLSPAVLSDPLFEWDRYLARLSRQRGSGRDAFPCFFFLWPGVSWEERTVLDCLGLHSTDSKGEREEMILEWNREGLTEREREREREREGERERERLSILPLLRTMQLEESWILSSQNRPWGPDAKMSSFHILKDEANVALCSRLTFNGRSSVFELSKFSRGAVWNLFKFFLRVLHSENRSHVKMIMEWNSTESGDYFNVVLWNHLPLVTVDKSREKIITKSYVPVVKSIFSLSTLWFL